MDNFKLKPSVIASRGPVGSVSVAEFAAQMRMSVRAVEMALARARQAGDERAVLPSWARGAA